MLEYVEVPLNARIEQDKLVGDVNKKVGKGDWYWGFRVGKKLYSWVWGLQIYEDAYWEFMKQSPTEIRNLVGYYDVYVNDRSDLVSGLEYKKQNKEHFQDIAIRRCLIRFGVWFKGTDILKIPGSSLDDLNIKFHLPHLIHKPDAFSSIRSWLTNRLIIIARSVEDKARLSGILIK